MRLVFVIPIVLLAVTQAVAVQAKDCGTTPESIRYKSHDAKGGVIYPGYGLALDRWSSCLKDRTQEYKLNAIKAKAAEALKAANKLHRDGVRTTVGNILGERIDNVMEVSVGSGATPSSVLSQGHKTINSTYASGAGGSGASRAIGSNSTRIALDTTARAATAFDAVMAKTSGSEAPNVASITPIYAPSFAPLGAISSYPSPKDMFEADSARTASTSSQNMVRTAAASSVYQSNIASARVDSEDLLVEYKARQAKLARDRAKNASDWRMMQIQAGIRPSNRGKSSSPSRSTTVNTRGWGDQGR